MPHSALHFRVGEELEAAGVRYLIREHAAMPVPIRSPADLAESLGYPLGRIMKTLVCRSRSTGSYVAIVCPVDQRVDFRGVARLLDCGRLEVASDAELESTTGYPRGGVSPVGLRDEVSVVIARQAMEHQTVLIGGGTPGVEVELAPQALQDLVGGIVADVGLPSRPPDVS